MSDLIPRHKALKVLEEYHNASLEIKGGTYAAAVMELKTMTAEPCEDTVSRQATIDVLKRDTCVGNRVLDIVKALPSAQPEQRWIPCSERLPEEKDAKILKKLGINMRSDYVLATVEVKGERMTILSHTFDGVWQWDKKYAFPDYNVIAWMPLPEPYKGENDEQIRGFGL